jgi:hypothetical protein
MTDDDPLDPSEFNIEIPPVVVSKHGVKVAAYQPPHKKNPSDKTKPPVSTKKT